MRWFLYKILDLMPGIIFLLFIGSLLWNELMYVLLTSIIVYVILDEIVRRIWGR